MIMKWMNHFSVVNWDMIYIIFFFIWHAQYLKVILKLDKFRLGQVD